MEQPLLAEPPRAAVADRTRIEDMLSVYPDITPDQAAEIGAFLRDAPILERGLLGQSELTRANLADFRKHHRTDAAIMAREWLALAAIATLAAMAICLLWDIGR